MKSIIALCLGLCLMLTAPSAHAEWESGATFLTANLGYMAAEGRVTGNTLHSGALGVALDFLIPDEVISFGLAFGYISGDENAFLSLDGGPEQTTELAYNSASYYGTFKGWFGGTRTRGYIGTGFGFHNSRLETSYGSEYRIQSETGFAFTIPVGLIHFVGDKVFLDVSGLLSFMGDSFYKKNAAYGVTGGIGFKL